MQTIFLKMFLLVSSLQIMPRKTEDEAKKKPGSSAVTILHFAPRRGACPFLFNHLIILPKAPVHYQGSNCMLHSISYRA